MIRNKTWSVIWVALGVCILLVGCRGVPTSQAPPTPDLLLQAGFQAQPAKSPDHIRNLPGHQLVTFRRQGRTIYVYTEPKSKHLYFGSENAYYRYKAWVAATRAAEVQHAPPSAQPRLGLIDWDLYADSYGGLD